jgi:diguanylate cyclase (GGDEF)-like protein/PAS domain S-box-containing protein
MSSKSKSVHKRKQPYHPHPRGVLSQLYNAPIGIYLTSLKGQLLFVNDFAAQGLGYESPQQMIDSISNVSSQIYAKPDQRDEIVNMVLAKGKVVNYECQLIRRDGSRIWVSNTIQAVRNEKGDIKYLQGFGVDITEKKIGQDALARSEKVYRTLSEGLPVLICRYDHNCVISYVNEAYCDFFGKSRHELQGTSFLDLIPISDQKPFIQAIGSLNPGLPNITTEHRVFSAQNQIRWMRWIDQAVFDDQENVSFYQSIGEDITEQKEIREELRVKSLVLDQISDLVTITDLNGVITYVNHAQEGFLGLARHEIIGGFAEEFPGNLFFNEDGHPAEGTGSEQLRMQLDEMIRGQRHVLDLRPQTIRDLGGKRLGVVSVATDVTEAKKAEEALLRKEAFERLLMELAARFINISLEEIEQSINQILEKIGSFIGVDRVYVFKHDHEAGLTFNTHEWSAPGIEPQKDNLQAIPMDILTEVTKALRKEEVYYVSNVAEMPQQSIFYQHIQKQNIQSLLVLPLLQDDSISGLVGFDMVRKAREFQALEVNLLKVVAGIISNVMARQVMEEKLRENEALLSAIVDKDRDLIFVKDIYLRYVKINKAMAAFYGINREEFIGKTDLELMEPKTILSTKDKERTVLKGHSVEETISLTINDKTLHFWTKKFPFRNRKGEITGLYGIAQDITDKKDAEDNLKKHNRLLEGIINGIEDILAIQYPDHSIERYNQAGYKALNLSPEEIKNKKCYELIGRNSECDQCATRMAIKSGKYEVIEKYVPEMGAYLECRSNPVIDDKGKIIYIVEQLRDITKQVEAAKALRESEERYRLLFEYSPLGVLQTDKEGVIIDCNENFVRIMGSSQDKIIGIDVMSLPDKKIVAQFSKALAGGTGYYEGEYTSVTSLKKTPVKSHFAAIMGANNEVLGCVGIFEDTSRQMEYERQLKHLNFHDQLTGLYNRAYFENELKTLKSRGDYPITIISFDVDEMKMINDSLGHERGDEYLKACAVLLRDSLRDQDTLARIGGDEFAAMLPGIGHETGKKIVTRIRSRLDEFNNNQKKDQIPLSMSMGMATTNHSSPDLHAVFKEADDEMYRDKMSRDNSSKSKIVKALLTALDERDYITHGHAQRLDDLCQKLAIEAGLSPKQQSDLALLALVHDLGKVGIPDNILFKPGPLTPEEWEVMRLHPEKGWRIAQASEDLADIADLILKHHESWDGTGYPLGLAGEEIPIECRILAIADSFDAMTNDRPYRKAVSSEEAKEEIRRCAGTQFDPALVEMFLRLV